MELKTTHIAQRDQINPLQQDALLAALREIIHATDKHSRAVVKQFGLSTAHIVILRAIQTLDEGTTRQLSKNVSLSQATVTVLLNKLESLNLIERKRSETDKRIVHSRLTQNGKARSETDKRIVHSRLTQNGKALLRQSPQPLPAHFTQAFSALSESRQAEILAAFFDVAQMMSNGDYAVQPPAVTPGSVF